MEGPQLIWALQPLVGGAGRVATRDAPQRKTLLLPSPAVPPSGPLTRSQTAREHPRTSWGKPAPNKPEASAYLPRDRDGNVSRSPSLGKQGSCVILCQQHLCPWGCSTRRVSFRTPQSFPLTEIAGSEHKHRRLSLPMHVSHQPGMVSSPSIHHAGFLSLLL